MIASRKSEADEFYAAIASSDLTDDERLVQRQALAGLLWCKQYYHYAVRRWLQGDEGEPVPPAERWEGRNSTWQHFVFADVILMPDAWEYPWFAAWDLAFHCVAMALIDPNFAKQQVLVLLSSTRYRTPDRRRRRHPRLDQSDRTEQALLLAPISPRYARSSPDARA